MTCNGCAGLGVITDPFTDRTVAVCDDCGGTGMYIESEVEHANWDQNVAAEDINDMWENEEADRLFLAANDVDHAWEMRHPYYGMHCPDCGAGVVDIHGTHETFGDYDYLKCEDDCGWEEW